MNFNIIFEFAEKNFDSKPEYLWRKFPDVAILRNNKNKKWYAVIMKVAKKKLGIDEVGDTKILNLKLAPIMISSLINKEGFYPAYHMNKEHWMSIDLNNKKLIGDEILSLIRLSFEIVDSSKFISGLEN